MGEVSKRVKIRETDVVEQRLVTSLTPLPLSRTFIYVDPTEYFVANSYIHSSVDRIQKALAMGTTELKRSPPPEYNSTEDLKSTVPAPHEANGDHAVNGNDTKSTETKREKSESLSPPPMTSSEQITIDANDEEAVEVKLEDDKVKVEEQKRKYDEEEKKLRGLEPPPAQTLQEE